MARPATSEEATRVSGARAQTQARGMRLDQGVEKAIVSARAAAKLIWKPAFTRLSGRSTSTTVAATATDRSDSARRSRRMAPSATAAITKARSVATSRPASAR